MIVPVYSIDGSVKGEKKIPEIFNESVRKDLIMRAFLAEQSEKLQPKGPFEWAGLLTSARYIGRKEAYHSLKNRGIARGPRVMFPKGRIGPVRRAPFAVKGRAAHPPTPKKKIVEKINKKEKEKALRSAIAATAKEEFIKEKHSIEKLKFPIVFEENFEKISKTKEAIKILQKIIGKDLERAQKRKERNKRKKGIKVPKSALIVVSQENAPLLKAARNIPGIDTVDADKINVSLLAPGGVPGRLTIWTESALEKIKSRFGEKG